MEALSSLLFNGIAVLGARVIDYLSHDANAGRQQGEKARITKSGKTTKQTKGSQR